MLARLEAVELSPLRQARVESFARDLADWHAPTSPGCEGARPIVTAR